MARTKAGEYLTAVEKRQQLGLRAATVRDLTKLWPTWDLDRPGSYEEMVEALIVLAQARNQQSAALAARYYEMFKNVDAPVSGLKLTWGKAVQLAEAPPPSQIRAAINATAKAGVYRALGAGFTREKALQSGLVQVAGSLTRIVMAGGRETLIEAVRQDPVALGWCRVTDYDPCAFCAMLASRGPVYKEEDTAGFEAHDHCVCTAEPFYRNSQWPARSREFHDLWQQTKHDTDTDPLNAFRRAIEGRGQDEE